MALGSLGAFLVLEERSHADGARRQATRAAVDRACRSVPAPARRLDHRGAGADVGNGSRRRPRPRRIAVISGATGAEPATDEGTRLLLSTMPDVPVRATGAAVSAMVSSRNSP